VKTMLGWLPCAACQKRADPFAFAAKEHRLLGDEHVKKKEFSEAITAYTKAISGQPKDAAGWIGRADVYRELQDWQQALRDATRALTLDPSSEKAVAAKVHAMHKMGKLEDALQECEAALETRTKSIALNELRRDLREDRSREAEKAEKKKQAEPKAKAANKKQPEAPKAAPKPAAKKAPIDYSKWEHFEDSDDEAEKQKEKIQKWTGPNPSMEERLGLTEDMLEVCRSTHQDATAYFGEVASSFKSAVKLPPDHNRSVGVMSVEELGKYKCSNERMLVSIYGDIYDVSSRPDLYGYGPKSTHSGKDITWGVVCGLENEKNFNRFYDIFKLDADHTKRYMQIICQRMVCFEEQFGEPLGRLEPFVNERDLPPAPKEEIEECNQQ